jgi:hypothetical protein
MREEKKRGVCGKKEKSEFCSLLWFPSDSMHNKQASKQDTQDKKTSWSVQRLNNDYVQACTGVPGSS